MHTRSLIRALAILTGAGLAAGAAEAGSGDRFWSGIAPSFSHPAEPQPARSHERVTQTYERERRPMRLRPVAPPRAPVVAYADGRGREYDLASRAWFDGDGECWLGSEAFTVRHGQWFYGKSRWREIDGVWRTDAAVPPTRVDCRPIAKFTAKLRPAPEQQATRSVLTQDGEGFARPDAMGPVTAPHMRFSAEGANHVRGGPGTPPVGAPASGTHTAPSTCRAHLPSIGGTPPAACDP